MNLAWKSYGDINTVHAQKANMGTQYVRSTILPSVDLPCRFTLYSVFGILTQQQLQTLNPPHNPLSCQHDSYT